MKLSPRERWMLAFLPPVLLLGGWHGLWRPDLEAQHERATQRIVAAGTPQKTATNERAARDEHAKLERAITDAQTLDQQLAEKETALLARWAKSNARPDTVRMLSELFTRRGMRVESSGPAQSASEVSLSPALVDLGRALRELRAEEPATWRIELRGEYPMLVEALQELESVSDFALPISVAADAMSKSGERSFQLWLWI